MTERAVPVEKSIFVGGRYRWRGDQGGQAGALTSEGLEVSKRQHGGSGEDGAKWCEPRGSGAFSQHVEAVELCVWLTKQGVLPTSCPESPTASGKVEGSGLSWERMLGSVRVRCHVCVQQHFQRAQWKV